uniref:Reverse transcriptase domain-containing protein n=2 Tax=Trichogramma kaykai TaxID=54128 RepID=A0ABD2XL42_9HYME
MAPLPSVHRFNSRPLSKSRPLVRKNLKIGSININRFSANFNLLEQRILSGTYDIVSVVETFLESSDNISPFHIAGYNFLHCHRRGKEGGGVGLYVREDLAIEKIVATESIYDYMPEYQIISIKNANNMKLLFATVYRSPEAGYPEEFFEVLYRLQPLYDNVIVTGDFNIHVNRPGDQHVGRLIKQLEQLSLYLVSTMPTHHVIYHDGSIHKNCLDLVIVRDTFLIESFSRSSSPFAAAHDFIDFEYKLSHEIAPSVTKFTRYFRRVRTETFAPLVERDISIGFSRDGLSLFVVDEAAVGGRVVTRALLDLAVATLSSALLAAADLVAPLSAPRLASRRKPWVTSQIRSLIRERDRAYRLFRRGGSSADAYKELRSRVRNLLDTAKNQHLASRVAGAADVQSRWHALRSMGVSSPRLPSPLASFSADELCSHYVAVGSRAPPLDISMANVAVPAERRTVFDFRHVTEDEVRLTMARCVAKGFGLDGISSTILRLSSPAILRVITRIVNASMDLGYFPVSWKTAAVIPLAKGSSVASPSDTRPISLLSELSKIVERIIHAQLTEYLSQSDLLDPGQHGFRPGHSTTTALLEIAERARRAIDRREVSILVSFDFSKAFDTIDHTILIRKLICAGCSDCVIEWFVNYLSGRSVCAAGGWHAYGAKSGHIRRSSR